MKCTSPTSLILSKMALVLGMGLIITAASAATTDIATMPMGNKTGKVVKPNLMFILDDSGSMDFDYMPDSVKDDNACKSTGSNLTGCAFGDPAYNAALFNGITYNPATTYTPAVNFDGTSRTSYTTWGAVPKDAYGVQSTGTIDLVNDYPDIVYCSNGPNSTQRTAPFTNATFCRRPIQGGVWTYPSGSVNDRNSVSGTTSPYYYTITSLAWCSSKDANGFGTGTCQSKKTATYQYPKYGSAGNNGFARVDIVSSTANYPRAASRTDCTGTVGPTGCTYAQEMTNFANWYAYYRTRMQMMKTSAGLAFRQVTDAFRVGFITIHPGSPVTTTKYLPVSDFTAGVGGQKANWYTKFYAQDASGGTPLREALSRVGRYYAHVTTGINAGMSDDPMQYSCQQNFTILSTDGFWNGASGDKLDGSAIGNQDSNISTAPRPMLDGSFELTTVATQDTLTQNICTGSATVFGATPCGCAANFKRVKQQTSNSTNTQVSRDGVTSSNTTTTGTSYDDITACNAIVTTAVTTTLRNDEQVLTGNATSTFPAVNGITAGANQNGSCAANFANVKHRTTTGTSTVITTGGVAAPATLGATYNFSNSACVPVVVTAVTPVTVDEEQIALGGVATTFGTIGGVSAGANANGSCPAGQKNRKHRRTTYNSTVVTTGGSAGAPTATGVSYTLTNVGACVLPTVNTSTVTTTVVEEQVVVGTASSTFSPVNGVVAGANAAGTCTAPQKRIKRRTTTYTTTTTTTDGVAAAPVVAGTGYAFANVGSCVSPMVVTGTSLVTETEQVQCNSNSSAAFTAGGANNAAGTTSCGCTALQKRNRQRVITYNRVTVTTDGVLTSTTDGNVISTNFGGSACTLGTPPALISPNPGLAVGSPSNSTTGGPTPNPASTSTNNSTANSSTGGPTPVPLATTSSNGTTVSTTSGLPTAAGTTTGTPSTISNSVGAAITSADLTITPVSGTTAGPKTINGNTSTSGPMGFGDTLADVAQYYYVTDLRGPGSMGAAAGTPSIQHDVGTVDNVNSKVSQNVQDDTALWQHMTTFTLGLGLDGTLTYDPLYREPTTTTGDFISITNGAINWPEPVEDTLTAVDDLWHAAVNGRGRYFSAKDPGQLVAGLASALADVEAKVGSGAQAATSNLEPVPGDNLAYVANYETVRWNGNVEAKSINLATGALTEPPVWTAQTQLDILANSTTPGGNARKIVRFNSAGTNKLQDFTWANLTATEQNYFNATWIGSGGTPLTSFPPLSHWGALDATQKAAAAGANLVNFIRGDSTYEAQATVLAALQYYRDRQHVLGDVVNGAPVYVKKVSAAYADPGYSAPAGANFKECVNTSGVTCSGIYSGSRDPSNIVSGVDLGSARSSTVYIAANDGMLHALNGDTGAERWAYIPNILIPNLYKLADKDYANRHQYFVDGAPTVGDIYDPIAAKWKTILVGGLGNGGRGFYALDITDPATPIGLWEFNVRAAASCPTSTVLGTDKDDCDLGLSFGNPIITKLGNGNWVVVVTSGYNNVSPGDGKGYVYVLNPISGVVLKKIQATNAAQFLNPGSTTTPLGLSRIFNWVDDTNLNNTTLRVYGGDLQGYVWRFDLDASTAYSIARLTDPSGVAQPVTTKPELGEVNGQAFVYVGTGRFLGTTDVGTTQVQTIYGIKDATNGAPPSVPVSARGTSFVAQTMTNGTGAAVATRTATSNPVDVTTKNGWRIDLPDSGERVNVDLKLQLGTLVVGSNVPIPSDCTFDGYSWLNYLDYKTGGYIQSSGNTLAGVKISNALIVGISIVRLPEDKTVAIVTTSDNKYPNLAPPFSTPSPTGRRSTWRELQ